MSVPDDVTLPCGHGCLPGHDMGERLIHCPCGESWVLSAKRESVVLYDVRPFTRVPT